MRRDFGWPPKKTDKQINANENKIVALVQPEMNELVAAAAAA